MFAPLYRVLWLHSGVWVGRDTFFASFGNYSSRYIPQVEFVASNWRANVRVFVQILQISAKMAGKWIFLNFRASVSGPMATFGCLGGSGHVFCVVWQLFYPLYTSSTICSFRFTFKFSGFRADSANLSQNGWEVKFFQFSCLCIGSYGYIRVSGWVGARFLHRLTTVLAAIYLK